MLTVCSILIALPQILAITAAEAPQEKTRTEAVELLSRLSVRNESYTSEKTKCLSSYKREHIDKLSGFMVKFTKDNAAEIFSGEQFDQKYLINYMVNNKEYIDLLSRDKSLQKILIGENVDALISANPGLSGWTCSVLAMPDLPIRFAEPIKKCTIKFGAIFMNEFNEKSKEKNLTVEDSNAFLKKWEHVLNVK
ncbi:hypothetical protein [Craterilacuibacter sinensis]|uniref:Uncharacterized protein n=1 Tax=Craterilacuibacter sinensis TaxID=2686017 RepID=A0A845BKZ4_9NEIS|nr:hypothetical protein [Craterilacuibacter sinensis]MXR35954.1 hypothetical protein [Craterilacuibacter sinensis]